MPQDSSAHDDALGWRLDDDDGFACFDGTIKIRRVLPISPAPRAGEWNWFAFWFASLNTGRELDKVEFGAVAAGRIVAISADHIPVADLVGELVSGHGLALSRPA